MHIRNKHTLHANHLFSLNKVILSYLTDFVEERDDVEECSLKSVRELDRLLSIKELGFTHVEEEDEDKILDLFTIDGRILLFKQSKLYQKYFEWYTEGITFEEIKEIYNKHNIDFNDVFYINRKNKQEHVRKMK